MMVRGKILLPLSMTSAENLAFSKLCGRLLGGMVVVTRVKDASTVESPASRRSALMSLRERFLDRAEGSDSPRWFYFCLSEPCF